MTAKNVNVVVAGESDRFTSFLTAMQGLVSSVQLVSSGSGLLKMVAAGAVQIAVVDEKLEDMDGLSLVNRIAENHPFVNTALVSTLSEHDFHEETEGLGVLMQIPSLPDGESAEKLMAHYRSIWG